jgi:hypothetical protein
MSPSSTWSSAQAERRAIEWGRYALVGLATVVAAVLANVIVYFLGSLIVTYDPQFVILANPSGAIIFTVVPAIVAVLLYALLLRFTAHPARIFTIIAAVILVVSWIPDLTYIPTVPGSSAEQTVVLMVMHLVAATVIVWMLTRLAPSPTR